MEILQNKTENEPARADDASSLWVAERLVELMAEHGVTARQQANLLSDLCGLSLSQARRKLRGAMWSFDEVLAVARHFGASIDQIFLHSASGSIIHASITPGASAQPLQDATFLMDKLALPCQVRLGTLVVGTPGDDELLAAQNQEGWVVGTKKQLDRHRVKGSCYLANQVILTPSTTKPSIRIAILDDDVGTSETLGEWFNEAGYAATAFTSCDDLLASNIENYDTFVVDFMLAGGDSSQAIIKTIRQALPDAPVLLLTGKLRDGQASEADLTAMLRTSNVTFFEKPVRPSILAAAIEKELDQVASRRAG
jgi:CheY-like chemotaxis protein